MVADGQPVALIMQTRVLPNRDLDFERWLDQLETAAQGFTGYLDQKAIEPAPPTQTEWVVVQRFDGIERAQLWLTSTTRRHLVDNIQPSLIGHFDIHLLTEGTEPPSSAVSAVVTTRVAPEKVEAFLRWHARIAAAQASFPGYQGYRLERPIPGVQEDWVGILRFHSEPHLDAWLSSESRRRLLREAGALAQEVRIRTVRSGFDAWFDFEETPTQPTSPPVWKMNMLVLLALYPVVFLFGEWVHTPLLIENDIPFWLALFIGNIVSVALLGWILVPWLSRRFQWWLAPAAPNPAIRTFTGAALVAGIYTAFLALFSQL